MDSEKMNSEEGGGGKDSLEQSGENLLAQAEVLIWSLLDDDIEPTDVKRLEVMMKEHEQVRLRYVDCVQLHTDLHQHFGEPKAPLTKAEPPQSPVLGSLGDLRPGTDSWPPVAE